ncbi:MAG: TonB family protein [Bacteroidetes bacterium]|jgi:TonB family protein|nr:TonB family protein [Bacteroidota bacterium]MBT5530366.1 TonB family protein [Cytophagia bacterium]MBT3424449.1 TonB family protein [Bacteroidota bacterium]MBT3801815.1 TonB family protein [Bacteroidota bacterium]MBT3934136.1 TonB family protein [Bacteroidota bacterium]
MKLKSNYHFSNFIPIFLLLFISNSAFSQSSIDYKAVNKGDYYIFVNEDGKKTVKGKYKEAKDFSEGLAAVKFVDSWGYINNRGKVIIPIIYEEAWPFKDGYAKVKINGRITSIDKNGRGLGYLTMNYYVLETEGLSRYRNNSKYGFVNAKEEIIIPLEFDTVADFNQSYARVSKNGKWGVIDKSGRVVISFEYDFVYPFRYDYFMLRIVDNDTCKYNFIKLSGELISNEWFEEGISFYKGNAFVVQDGSSFRMNQKGELTALSDSFQIKSACGLNTTFEIDSSIKPTADSLLLIFENPPQFKDGDSGRNKFLWKNIQYPDLERDNGIQGLVVVEFVVNKNGNIQDVAIKKGITPNINKEVLRIIGLMSDWEPGSLYGIPECVRIYLPVRFVLN